MTEASVAYFAPDRPDVIRGARAALQATLESDIRSLRYATSWEDFKYRTGRIGAMEIAIAEFDAAEKNTRS